MMVIANHLDYSGYLFIAVIGTLPDSLSSDLEY